MSLQQTVTGALAEGNGNGGRAVVSVLRSDPDLAPALSPGRRRDAERLSVARVWHARGPLLDREATEHAEAGFGMLILSGALCRRITQDARTGAELLGPGDVARPWDRCEEWSELPMGTGWGVVKPAELAILDRGFAERVACYPDIAIELHRRAVRRTTRVAAMVGTLSQPRVEDRLMILFSQLGERFGRTRPGCIHIPLPLTHSLLAELVAVRRPSATKALAGLQSKEILVRDEEGWVLRRTDLSAFLSDPHPNAATGNEGRPGGW